MSRQIVKPGQVWESCDKRDCGRRILITGIHRSGDYAYGASRHDSKSRRATSIRLDRFKPVRNGYRLVEEALTCSLCGEWIADLDLGAIDSDGCSVHADCYADAEAVR